MLIDRMGGMEPLNMHMKELGLQQSNLSRKMMDFRARARGSENYTSAADIGGILERIYRGEILDKTRSQIALDILKHQKYRDRIPAQLPRDIVVAHKTGLENNIVHDAGIVYTPNGDFMVCVLTRSPALYRDAKHLIGWISYDVYQYMLRSKNLDEFKLFPNVGIQSVS